MGRMIDIDKARKEYSNLTDLTMSDTTLLLTLFDVLDNAPTIEAIPKADYEARLKADLVAMLTEIQLEIQELWDADPSYIEGVYDSEMVIQQKIDKLKGNENGNE